MKFVITGGAGFIGSNIIKELNDNGIKDIIVVDDLTDAEKFKNLVGLEFIDYFDKDNFNLYSADVGPNDVIIHMGAISTTTADNGKKVMKENYEYSRELFKESNELDIEKFIYASTAAVYGRNKEQKEHPKNENPLNMYAFSKLAFDNYLRNFYARTNMEYSTKAIGLRFFNCYGPGETHKEKDKQTSPFYNFYKTLHLGDTIKLFEGKDYFGDEARLSSRDFVYVKDCAKVVCWLACNNIMEDTCFEIFNVGTGETHTFHEVATLALKEYQKQFRFIPNEYIPKNPYDSTIDVLDPKHFITTQPIPHNLRKQLQSYTKADLTKLRKFGCKIKFKNIQEGAEEYFEWLRNNNQRKNYV